MTKASAATATRAVACVAAAAVVGGAAPASSTSLLHTPPTTAASSINTIPLVVPRGGQQHQQQEENSDKGKKRQSRKKTKKTNATNKKKASKRADKKTKATKGKTASSTADDDASQDGTATETSSNNNNIHESEEEPLPPKKTHSHQDRIVKEILKQDDYYAILGVSRTATNVEITKAYRRKCVLTHPDKMSCGDRKAFDKVAEAYDVLSDDSKRSIYNQFGKAGVKSNEATGRHAQPSFSEDILRSFFGVGRSQQQPRQPRNRPIRLQMDVTLQDLYKGLTRTVLVPVARHRPPKEVEVHVPRGMSSGESIVLAGEVDAIPDATPADLSILLTQRPHEFFVRKGHDLALELDISLEAALCGFTHTFQHLDGRQVKISSARRADGEPIIIQSGDVQVLKGEGMPKRAENTLGGHGHHHDDDDDESSGHGTNYGDLYVQYVVKMPSSKTAHKRLTVEERQELQRLLAKLEGEEPKTDQSATDENEDKKDIHVLQPASSSDFGRASGPYKKARDFADPHMAQDEEEGHGRPNFPFGSRQFHYYSNSGGNPFFGRGFGDAFTEDEDDGNVQCQQM